jgi:hypothetical protein
MRPQPSQKGGSRVLPAYQGTPGRVPLLLTYVTRFQGSLSRLEVAGVSRWDLSSLNHPTAMALVPGLGLVVRDSGLAVFGGTPDGIAMACMSLLRVAWLVAVARGGLARHCQLGAEAAEPEVVALEGLGQGCPKAPNRRKVH